MFMTVNFGSVLPPPPRYPVAQTTSSPHGPNVNPPALEMSNILTHPTGPEFQLSVGEGTRIPALYYQTTFLLKCEGTYILIDSLHLATPPPHPQDAPIVSSNPLATTPCPPKAGVKLSICVINPRTSSQTLYKVNTSTSTTSNLGTYSIKEQERESRSSHDTSSDGKNSHLPSNGTPERTPVFGEDNALLTPGAGKEGPRRKKPKTNLVKSNSQFISRVIPHDQLNKRLQEHLPEGVFLFANIDRAYQWLDMSSPTPGRV